MKFASAWQPSGVERLNPAIEQYKAKVAEATPEKRGPLLARLLVLQTPRAALAQAQMDAHPRGYHDREKRLFELIDFNDTFVSCVLATPPHELAGVDARLQRAMSNFCRQQKTPMFSDEQFAAIVRGLSREIAVFVGARAEGLAVTMTSRTEDAFGIDMVVTDPMTRRFINIDVKTPSAFRYRLEELKQEGRISDDERYAADERDFVVVVNRHDYDKIPVVIVCVRPERLGDVIDFRFENEEALGGLLHQIIAKHGLEVVK